MRVYVVSANTDQGTYVQEVFVSEQDAKKYIASEQVKMEVDDRELVDYHIDPRTLRTGWNG